MKKTSHRKGDNICKHLPNKGLGSKIYKNF